MGCGRQQNNHSSKRTWIGVCAINGKQMSDPAIAIATAKFGETWHDFSKGCNDQASATKRYRKADEARRFFCELNQRAGDLRPVSDGRGLYIDRQ